ncbi:hypothetical protein AMECASPLE_017850 [Ameca splendens]|uniref:Uncharacterized protein n=1 Tax=Ameca splendens TaxID=208324 RepID=A0ABV0ZCL6_9TELE
MGQMQCSRIANPPRKKWDREHSMHCLGQQVSQVCCYLPRCAHSPRMAAGAAVCSDAHQTPLSVSTPSPPTAQDSVLQVLAPA